MLSYLANFIFYHTPIFYLIQSVWRDEAFSYFMAKPNVLRVITNTAHDFNPPLYYVLLNFWMKFVGQSDEGLRMLSFLAHIACVYIAFYFASKLFSKKFAFFVAAFTFFNPMLLYYAFEMRMYSFYALFTFASVYCFYIKNWKWYTISTVLGLYTHSFFPFIPVSFLIYLKLTGSLTRKIIYSTLKPFLFYLFWLPILVIQFFNSKDSWLFPVDFQLVKSVLGNIFTSYEGTPGELWPLTALLSGIIIFYCAIVLKRRKKLALYLLTPIIFPLFVILGYSILMRPLFVNRYMIFIVVFEILAISAGIFYIHKRTTRWLSMLFWLVLVVILNIIIPPYRKKTDFKTTFAEINAITTPNDFVYAKTPIGFFESAYYYKYTDKTFIYNPNNVTIPNYIGVTVVFPEISRASFPTPPSRTFLVNDDASYEMIVNN